jgi:hypothetical protein
MSSPFQIVPALVGRDIPGVAVLIEQCVCCWQVAHPDQPYPAAWSSTLCTPHMYWTKQCRRAACQARAQVSKEARS